MTNEELLIMQKHVFFEAIPKEGLQLLWDSGDQRRLRASEVLFHIGQRADSAFILLKGTASLSDNANSRGITVVSGALIGDIALIIEGKRPATCIAKEESRILKISSGAYKKILSLYPEAANHVSNHLKERFHDLTQSLQNVRHSLESIKGINE